MSDHAGHCQGCPVLRQAALAERMARYGMIMDDVLGEFAKAILVAMLREEHGCRGPVRGGMTGGPECRLAPHFRSMVQLMPREDVPLLTRRRPDDSRPDDPGEFL